MGVTKLANTLKIEVKEAKALKDKYFEVFPKIKVLMESLAEEAKAKKFAYSPLDGRRRDLSYIDWDHPRQVGGALNQAKNFPFQGCGASTTKKAMILIRDEIRKYNLDARIINVVHDEILYEVHKTQAERVAQIVQLKMIEAFNFYAPDVPMVVKPEIGLKWIH